MVDACVMTIGNFDGVHRGHRAIVRRANELATQRGVGVTVVTFDPHPATVLRPEATPRRLTTRERKVELLREAGADHVEVIAPTREVLSLSPDAFIDRLSESHRPIAFVEGRDFRYGSERAGDVDTLARQGEQRGFAVDIVNAVEVALCDHLLAPVRSSFIRWLLSHGRVADAAICLGRPFELSGVVATGEKRGRTIGVPTLNLPADALRDMAIPADAVYAGVAALPDDSTRDAAISIGVKPTFGRRVRTIEAHLLDFAGDLYEKAVTLRFTRWLRDQQPFPSVELLKAQLRRDIENVRRVEEVRAVQ